MKKYCFLCGILLCTITNCQKNKFKTKHFLPELYDFKIAPELSELESMVVNLNYDWATISTNSSITDIEVFRTDYIDFLLEVEDVLFYNIGDINSTYLYGRFYKSDIDITKIWLAYNENSYFYIEEIQSMINSVKGVNTLEYLLFHSGAIDSVQTSTKYINFIDAHLQTVKNEIINTKTSWTVYQGNFIKMTDDGIEGSYNMVVNQIIHGLEDIIVKKIGEPLVNSDNFSETHLCLIKKSIEQYNSIFIGLGTKQFNSVYNHIRKKDKKLADTIKLDFENIIEQGNELTSTYTHYYNTNSENLITYRNNIETLMLKFKIQVISLIDVTLTIGDSDGD
jgi:hypothetical protein